MEILQRQPLQLRAWAASCGHVGLEVAVENCWGGRVPCHALHRGRKRAVIILPAHHGDAVFRTRALHKQLFPPVRVKRCRVLLREGFKG